MHSHSLAGQDVGDQAAGVRILPRQQHRGGLHDLHPAPQAGEGLAQLATARPAAKNRESRRQLSQIPDGLGGTRLGLRQAGDRRQCGPRAGGDDRRSEAQLASAGIDHSGSCEAAEGTDHLYALGL